MDRDIPTFSRGELPHFAGINTFMKAPYLEDVRLVRRARARARDGRAARARARATYGARARGEFGRRGSGGSPALYSPYDLREMGALDGCASG